jgi:hypothetical protein
MSNIPDRATHESNDLKYCKDGGKWYYWDDVLKMWAASENDDEWRSANLRPIGVIQTHDTVQNPKHYQLLPGVEVYDIRQALAAKATAAGATLDQFSDYDRAVEYLLRMWEKNGVEDAQKAAWYLNKLVEKLNGSGS